MESNNEHFLGINNYPVFDMAIWNTRDKNGSWKGGRVIASNGYVLIKVGTEHHLSDVRGYAYEHRLVAEKTIGRRLLPQEQVHHKNHNKQDNSPDNLIVTEDIKHHRAKHRNRCDLRLPDDPNPQIECGCGCGIVFTKFDRWNRPRMYVSGHNPQQIDQDGRYIPTSQDLAQSRPA